MTTPPYKAVIDGFHLNRHIPCKTYFISLVGRDNPELYDWKFNSLSQKDVIHGLHSLLDEIVPIYTPAVALVYPHLAKCFRFGSDEENNDLERISNLPDLGLYETPNLLTGAPTRLNTGLIGCLGEIELFAYEAEQWRKAQSVPVYLRKHLPVGEVVAELRNRGKLRAYRRRFK